MRTRLPDYLLAWLRLHAVAVLIAVLVGGGAVVGWLNADGGVYRDAVVLDTWTEWTCSSTGPPEQPTTTTCRTLYWAWLSYEENGHERTAQLVGTFTPGERTELFVGRFGTQTTSWWGALALWLLPAFFVIVLVWMGD